MNYETITVDQPQEHTVLVTLNRPEVANAMNTQMGIDLLAAFDGFCAAPNKQRCIVLTGAGGDQPVVMLSGGSTPIPAYQNLATRGLTPAAGLTVLFSDDRYVPSAWR